MLLFKKFLGVFCTLSIKNILSELLVISKLVMGVSCVLFVLKFIFSLFLVSNPLPFLIMFFTGLLYQCSFIIFGYPVIGHHSLKMSTYDLRHAGCEGKVACYKNIDSSCCPALSIIPRKYYHPVISILHSLTFPIPTPYFPYHCDKRIFFLKVEVSKNLIPDLLFQSLDRCFQCASKTGL